MKRLKFLNAFLMLIMTLIVPFVLTSCDDEENTEKIELTKYKWLHKYYDASLYDPNDWELSVQVDKTWLYFLSDGTGIMSCKLTDYDTFFGTKRQEIAYRFRYSISGDQISLTFNDSKLNRKLTYSKDGLKDIDNKSYYEKLSFTSSEFDHAKELADEQEFQESINHNKIQSLDVFIGFGNNLQPVKFTSEYLWSVSFSCGMPKDSYRRGITLAGLVIYIDNGTITNKTGYDKESACTVKVVKLDGKNAYYFEHAVYSNEETQCGASMNVYSSSGSALKIHRAYRYYDNVSKTYFTSPSQEFVLTGDGIDASGDEDDPNSNNGGNTGNNGNSGGETGGNTTSTTGTHNGHEWVDLGLSVKWATCNLGANRSEDSGDYYAWGETKPKNIYNWSTYKWCNGTYNTLTKYCYPNYKGEPVYGKVDKKEKLDATDDAASVNWGGTWKMPTWTEAMELNNKCTWKWTTLNGVKGYKVTGNNGNSIFLPVTGYKNDSYLITNDEGHYLTQNVSVGNCYNANAIQFDSNDNCWPIWYSSDRCLGYSIRAVCK